MPKYYKYIPFGRSNSKRRKWTMDIFRNNHIYLGHFNELNDPMEAMFNASELTNYQIQQIKLKKPNIVIGCFSKTYSDVLMWTHYADNHLGCCVEFEIIEDDYLEPITYDSQIVNPSKVSLLEQCIDILTHKLSPWQYEQEVRYLKVIDPESTNRYLSINITKVYLGSKLTQKSVNHYKQLISRYSPDVDIQQVQIDELTWWNGEVNSILIR